MAATTHFTRELFKSDRRNASKDKLWIYKPANNACGRGISLISKQQKVKKKPGYLISQYIANPHLLNGYKYDLRLYVLVTCLCPLKVYLYDEGLARICTRKYSTKRNTLNDKYKHLTNFSINSKSESYIPNVNADDDQYGNKWSLEALRKKYKELGIDSDKIFDKIKDVIIKTLIAVEGPMQAVYSTSYANRNNFYELYGFDVLIDENLKPWLIEVNVCPSLNNSTPLDKRIKTSLICDIFNLLGYTPYDKKQLEKEVEKYKIEGKPKRSTRRKEDIEDLNAENCIDKLSAEDWNILFEFDEEFHRRGDFERIFPNKSNVAKYSKFF